MEKKTTYSLYFLLDIRFADPISAMALNSHFVVIGTMMGRLTALSLEDRKTSLLSEFSSENISDISFDDDSSFNVGVGDEEILLYEADFQNCSAITKKGRNKNYQNETEHTKKCENSYTMISKSIMFKVQLCQPEEGNVTITNVDAEFEFKDVKTGASESGTLPMTNYSVPLDFDGERFLWVEYLSDVERNICVVNILNSLEKPYKHLLKKQFGHISHCKLLKGNKIFLVRSLNICEIRNLDENFSLVESYKHKGDEVYAVDVYYEEEAKSETNGDANDRMNINTNNNMNNDDLYIKIQENNVGSIPIATNANANTITNTNPNVINHKTNQTKKNDNNELGMINKTTHLNTVNNTTKKEEGVAFVTLDIDGNVNVYENGKMQTVFNLYNIKDISQDHKDKQFFSMGYSYYIKFNKEYYAISSDHGCYIIKRKDA